MATQLEEFIKLKEQYDLLSNQYENLKKETNENTVIQSMNDMKEEYERLKDNTVSLYCFKSLDQRFELLSKTCQAAIVLVDHTRKKISQINRLNYDEKSLRKAEMEMIVIKDIIQDALTNK